MEDIGGEVSLGLLCQSEPNLGQDYQQDFISGIGSFGRAMHKHSAT
jgi:hypothetical protein